jgi:protein-tyrosine sulfotransferase
MANNFLDGSTDILPDGSVFQEPCSSPVFVLSASRSGSTLLRFILDSHPDLACPPETNIASACAGLARSWDALENTESGNQRPLTEPVRLSPHAALAVREAMDRAFAHYLRRRQKGRWCDKSLDTHYVADLVAQVYPAAKFICLFRHPMDVIASAVEARPWGLRWFGLDPFVARYPGDSVTAIGSYWLSCTQAILAFAEKHQESCHLLRYEDLVTAPEESAAAIFTFIGADQVPGITQKCFRTAHESGGASDDKIWFTTGITAGSIGRGVSVPARALSPQLRQPMNEALLRLGYRMVNDEWNDAAGPVDPRAEPYPADSAGVPAAMDDRLVVRELQEQELQETVRAIAMRVESAGDAVWEEISASWPTMMGTTIRFVVQSDAGEADELSLTFTPDRTADGNGNREPRTVMIASPATWRSLLSHSTNLITDILAGRLRCIDRADGDRFRSPAIHAVAALLQIARIPVTHTVRTP